MSQAKKVDSRARAQNGPSPEPLDLTDPNGSELLDEVALPSDPNFQSELEYDGYDSIEESDNDSFNSLDLEKKGEALGGLSISDRELGPDGGEESLIDPQENRK